MEYKHGYQIDGKVKRNLCTNRNCKHCGKLFLARISDLVKGKAKYCSWTCQLSSLAFTRKESKQGLNHHLMEVAHAQLNLAVKLKQITKPNQCSLCNKVGYIEAHHTDYAKPIDVIWLCVSCHHKQHI